MTPGKGQNKCKLSGQRNDQNLLADFLTFQDKAQHRNSLNSTFVLKISAIVSSNSDFAFTSVFFYLGLRKNFFSPLHCQFSQNNGRTGIFYNQCQKGKKADSNYFSILHKNTSPNIFWAEKMTLSLKFACGLSC